MLYPTKDIPSTQLEIEYYGADFPVETLIQRMEREEFIIPSFQREYVWNLEKASRFIESLLIGIPIPSLFLAKDKFSQKYIVIDGQQRLKTLQYFYQEFFPDGKKFKLKNVTKSYNNLTYSQLSPSAQRFLDNTIIHCIIIADTYDTRGIFYIFERLNTTGTELKAQEIRNALYNGSFSDLLQKLDQDKIWQKMYGKPDKRGDRQELILRFIALYFDLENYQGKMLDFLNQFMIKNQNLEQFSQEEITNIFINTIQFIHDCIGEKTFYYDESFSKPLYETIMIFVAKHLLNDLDCQTFKECYQFLSQDDTFRSYTKSSTTTKTNVMSRLEYIEKIYKTI